MHRREERRQFRSWRQSAGNFAGKQATWSTLLDGRFIDTMDENDAEGSGKQEDRLLIRDHSQILYQVQSGDADIKVLEEMGIYPQRNIKQ